MNHIQITYPTSTARADAGGAAAPSNGKSSLRIRIHPEPAGECVVEACTEIPGFSDRSQAPVSNYVLSEILGTLLKAYGSLPAAHSQRFRLIYLVEGVARCEEVWGTHPGVYPSRLPSVAISPTQEMWRLSRHTSAPGVSAPAD